MASPALGTYAERLTGDDLAALPSLTALDAAIVAAEPGFAVAVKYHMVMYAMPGDWRHWVCAMSANRGGTSLRFLYGVLLEDPRGVLRPGSSTLKTWDFAPDDPIDAAAVGGYVRDAVAKLEYFKANAKQVAADAKAEIERAKRAGR